MPDMENFFDNLPIDQLISQPIIAVAQGQSELYKAYYNFLFKLAFEKSDSSQGANTIEFILNRTITNNGDITEEQVEVKAPLLSLVPVPAFTMDEAAVDFTMEVKDEKHNKDIKTDESTDSVGCWRFSAKISGNVSTSSEHTRLSDQSAKYDISTRALQQPPTEGMEKLSSILASVIEPIESKTDE